MISKGYNLQNHPTIKPPLLWWQLPFAAALTLHGTVIQQCQLCRINRCEMLPISAVQQGSHVHWFNRLQYLCQACHRQLHCGQVSFPFFDDKTASKGIASTYYSFPFDHIMLGYKNGQQLYHLMPLIHAIRQLPKPKGCHIHNSLIIPVPTSPERLKERGFAPVWLLAQFLSFHWQIPLFTGVHRYERQHQQGLNREQRLDNMKDAFYFSHLPTAKRLIVFDDVVTTGATLQALVAALLSQANNYQITAYAVLHGNA